MRILTANLKFFYQRRAMWLAYLILAIFFSPFFSAVFSAKSSQYNHVYFFNALMGILCLGIVCGSLWKDTLGKSFSFCLPKSQTVPRRMFFIVGTVMNFLVSLLFVHSRRPETLFAALPLFLPVFFACMSFFLLAVLMTYQAAANSLLAGIFLLIPLMAFPSATRQIEVFLIAHPFIVTPIGIGLCVFAWFRTGRRNLRRKLCSTPFYTMFDNWNLSKVKRVREQLAARKIRPKDEQRRDRREGFFLARMKQYDVLSVGRNCWGWLYRSFGNPATKMGPGIVVASLFIALFAYIPKQSISMQWWIVLMPALMMGINLPLPLKHTILLPAGRKEHFRTVVVLLPVYTVLLMAVFAIVGLFWQGLYFLVPQVSFAEHTFRCTHFDWKYLIAPFFFLPLCFIIRRLFPREDAFGRILTMMITMVIVIPIISVISLGLIPWYIIALAAVLWPLCFGVYRNYFMKSKLTWPGRA